MRTRVLNDCTIAIDPNAAVVARDRDDVQVELGCQPPVEAQLLVAVVLPPFEGGGVDEVELERLLDLVRERAREHDPGNMRFDDPQLRDRKWKGVRPQQLVDAQERVRPGFSRAHEELQLLRCLEVNLRQRHRRGTRRDHVILKAIPA
jgi:hypothetical protein